MSTKTKLFSASLILAASLMTAGGAQAAGKAISQADLATNTSETGGNLNRCWGKIASELAHQGGLGIHTRSTTAANNVGGFTASEGDITNGFGITFNELNADGNHSRAGVGNTSKGLNSPHTVAPGDGGNGAHAITNAGLADIINPQTGVLFDDPGNPENFQLNEDG